MRWVDVWPKRSAATNSSIAIAIVSNINGYVHEIRKIADLAHAYGGYVYVDAIQAAGKPDQAAELELF